jgi:DNA-binding NarL/FixJ family response regulator
MSALTPAAVATRNLCSTESALVSVVVVDDHRFMCGLIRAMLERQHGRYRVVAEAGDALSAIKCCQQLKPDLLILDISLPDISGIDAVPDIRKVAPATRILLCTAYATDDRVLKALRSGADGFVEKTNTWDDFVEAVDQVSRGERFFCVESGPLGYAGSNGATPARVSLTPCEKEVLALIAQGHSASEVGVLLQMSAGTVETHRARMMQKLRVHDVAGLIAYAFRSGVVPVPAPRLHSTAK